MSKIVRSTTTALKLNNGPPIPVSCLKTWKEKPSEMKAAVKAMKDIE